MTENLETNQSSNKVIAPITSMSMRKELISSFLGEKAQEQLPVAGLKAQLEEFFNTVNRVSTNLDIFFQANDGYGSQLMAALSRSEIINLSNEDLALLEELQTKVGILSRSETFVEAGYNQLTDWMLAHDRTLELITGNGVFSPDADIQHTIQLLLTSSPATARGLMGADGALIGAVERYLDLTAAEKETEAQQSRALATAGRETGLKLRQKLARGGAVAMTALLAACDLQPPVGVAPTPVVEIKPEPLETGTVEEVDAAKSYEFIDLVDVGGAYIDPAVSPQPDLDLPLTSEGDEDQAALVAEMERQQVWVAEINQQKQILKEKIAELKPQGAFIGLYNSELQYVVAVVQEDQSGVDSDLKFEKGDALYLKQVDTTEQGDSVYELTVYPNYTEEFGEVKISEAPEAIQGFNPIVELAKVEDHLAVLNEQLDGSHLSLEQDAQSGEKIIVLTNKAGDIQVIGKIAFTTADQTVIKTEAGAEYSYTNLGVEAGKITLGGEVIEIKEAIAITNKEAIDQYVADISTDLGIELFLVPLSGEALSDFQGNAWALINLEEKNKLCNVFLDETTGKAMIQFYNKAGNKFEIPLQNLRFSNDRLAINTGGTEYISPKSLYWENSEITNIELPESIELAQLPAEIYESITDFLQGQEYSEKNKVVYDSNFAPGVETGLGLLQCRSKNVFIQGINLGIMTPEQTKKYFNIYGSESYLIWMGHNNRDNERIVIPYAIPRDQFEAVVAIRTTADPNRLYNYILSNNVARIYSQSEQKQFIDDLQVLEKQYIFLQIYTNVISRWPEAQGSNLKATTIVEIPVDPESSMGLPIAMSLGLERLQTIEAKLEAYEPVNLLVITNEMKEVPTDISPPIIFAVYVFSQQ